MRSPYRTKVLLALASFMAAGVAISNTASATVVGNSSFELPDTLHLSNSGSFAGGTQTGETYTAQTATSGAHYNPPGDAIPYWTVTMDDNNSTSTTPISGGGTPQAYGVDNPLSSKYFGTNGGTSGVYTLTSNTDYSFNSLAAIDNSYGYSHADGYQFAYVNIAKITGGVPGTTSHFAQFDYDPNDTASGGANPVVSLGNFVPGQTYDLGVAVGNRSDKNAYDYSITLTESFDGGLTYVPIGIASTGTSPGDKTDTWEEATYEFTATNADTGLIGIRLIGSINAGDSSDTTGTQINFDNVVLSVPEPASLGLLALLGVGGLLRRRRA